MFFFVFFQSVTSAQFCGVELEVFFNTLNVLLNNGIVCSLDVRFVRF